MSAEEERARTHAQRKKEVAEIIEEMEDKNFEKAIELATKCIRDCKEKDIFREAQCHYLIATALIAKHQDTTSEYNRIRNHIKRALGIWFLLEKDKKSENYAQLQIANVLLNFAILQSNAKKDASSLKACQKSLGIFKRLRHKEGVKRAETIFYILKTRKLTNEIGQIMLSGLRKEREAQ